MFRLMRHSDGHLYLSDKQALALLAVGIMTSGMVVKLTLDMRHLTEAVESVINTATVLVQDME